MKTGNGIKIPNIFSLILQITAYVTMNKITNFLDNIFLTLKREGKEKHVIFKYLKDVGI